MSEGTGKYWICIVGPVDEPCGDHPLRNAIDKAIDKAYPNQRILVSSGWGGASEVGALNDAWDADVEAVMHYDHSGDVESHNEHQ